MSNSARQRRLRWYLGWGGGLLLLLLLLVGGVQYRENVYRIARHLRRQFFPRPTPVPPTALHEVVVLPQTKRPNIILIVTDDLDADLGTLDTMPVFQQEIRAKGVSFDSFFVSVSVCCPSRATIFRGQYAHNHHIYAPMPPLGGHPAVRARGIESSTLPIWLQDAGYYTVLVGKYYNFFPPGENRLYIPPGWDEWYAPSKGTPFEGFNFTINANGQEVEYWGQDFYLTDVLTQYVMDILERQIQNERPFFLYIAPYAPHIPARPAPRHAHLFPTAQAPRTPSFNEADMSDKPPQLRELPPMSAEDIAELDALYRDRLRSMQAVDEMLQQIVQFLDAHGLWENTYLFFTSDNGFHLGQHRRGAGKGGPYEEDMRVPFFVRGPGIPAGYKLTNVLAGNVDLAPTIAELAGVQPPAWVDGRSLVPWLFEPTQEPSEWRQGYLYAFYGYKHDAMEDSPPPVFLGVRTTSYVYVEYNNGFTEVYDLRRDPYQLTNLAPRLPADFLQQLSDWAHALARCRAETCRQYEQQVPPPLPIP